jgi:hypothetical protein
MTLVAAEVQTNVRGMLQHGATGNQRESTARFDGKLKIGIRVGAGFEPHFMAVLLCLSQHLLQYRVPIWLAVLLQRLSTLWAVDTKQGWGFCPGAN